MIFFSAFLPIHENFRQNSDFVEVGHPLQQPHVFIHCSQERDNNWRWNLNLEYIFFSLSPSKAAKNPPPFDEGWYHTTFCIMATFTFICNFRLQLKEFFFISQKKVDFSFLRWIQTPPQICFQRVCICIHKPQ